MSTYTRLLWTTSGEEELTAIRLTVAAEATLHAANYWTVVVSLRRAATSTTAAQTTGETVGTYSTQTRTIPSGKPGVTISEDQVVTTMNDGDVLVAVVTETGTVSWTGLDPRLELDIKRNTR